MTAQSTCAVCSLMHIMLIVQEDGPNNDGSTELWKGYHCTWFSCSEHTGRHVMTCQRAGCANK